MDGMKSVQYSQDDRADLPIADESADSRAIIALLDRLHKLRAAATRQALARYGLHIGQPGILRFIMRNPGCTQREIADNARVTAASVAASVKRLEKAGMLNRRGDTADTRCNRVFITPLGERALAACLADLQALEDAMLAALNPGDMPAFAACVGAVCDRLRAIAESTVSGDMRTFC